MLLCFIPWHCLTLGSKLIIFSKSREGIRNDWADGQVDRVSQTLLALLWPIRFTHGLGLPCHFSLILVWCHRFYVCFPNVAFSIQTQTAKMCEKVYPIIIMLCLQSLATLLQYLVDGFLQTVMYQVIAELPTFCTTPFYLFYEQGIFPIELPLTKIMQCYEISEPTSRFKGLPNKVASDCIFHEGGSNYSIYWLV